MISFARDANCLWFPPDPGETVGPGPFPVLLFLHGRGEQGYGFGDLERVKAWGLPKFRAEGRRLVNGPFPFLVVAPQCPPDRTWCDAEVLQALDRLLDRLIETGEGDPVQLGATGFSSGEVGVFCLALHRPKRLAAIAPVCGACLTLDALPTLADLAAWIAYGEDDEFQALTAGSKAAVRRFAPYGKLIEKAYRLGRRGDESAHVRTCDAAYAEPELYRWLREQCRR